MVEEFVGQRAEQQDDLLQLHTTAFHAAWEQSDLIRQQPRPLFAILVPVHRQEGSLVAYTLRFHPLPNLSTLICTFLEKSYVRNETSALVHLLDLKLHHRTIETRKLESRLIGVDHHLAPIEHRLPSVNEGMEDVVGGEEDRTCNSVHCFAEINAIREPITFEYF